jgi:hypothetical protein
MALGVPNYLCIPIVKPLPRVLSRRYPGEASLSEIGLIAQSTKVPHGDDAGEAGLGTCPKLDGPMTRGKHMSSPTSGPRMRLGPQGDQQGCWHCLPLTISRNGEMRDSTCRISLGLSEETNQAIQYLHEAEF